MNLSIDYFIFAVIKVDILSIIVFFIIEFWICPDLLDFGEDIIANSQS